MSDFETDPNQDPCPTQLNRRQLARHMARQVDGLTVPMAAATLEAFIDAVTDTLARGGEVHLSGFGTFSLSHRPARLTQHPRTGQPIRIPASQVPHFRPSPQLRQQTQPGSQL